MRWRKSKFTRGNEEDAIGKQAYQTSFVKAPFSSVVVSLVRPSPILRYLSLYGHDSYIRVGR